MLGISGVPAAQASGKNRVLYVPDTFWSIPDRDQFEGRCCAERFDRGATLHQSIRAAVSRSDGRGGFGSAAAGCKEMRSSKVARAGGHGRNEDRSVIIRLRGSRAVVEGKLRAELNTG